MGGSPANTAFGFVNYTINVWDLLLIVVAAGAIYGRLIALETKVTPLWEWWNAAAERRRHEGREGPEDHS